MKPTSFMTSFLTILMATSIYTSCKKEVAEQVKDSEIFNNVNSLAIPISNPMMISPLKEQSVHV